MYDLLSDHWQKVYDATRHVIAKAKPTQITHTQGAADFSFRRESTVRLVANVAVQCVTVTRLARKSVPP